MYRRMRGRSTTQTASSAKFKRRFQCDTELLSASCATGMDTARKSKAHFIWTSVALIGVFVASFLTFVFVFKKHSSFCQRGNIISSPYLFKLSATSMGTTRSSGEHWLLKAQGSNDTDGRLIWQDEWAENSDNHETILDHTNMWIVIPEKGVYLLYIQANYQLKFQVNSSTTKKLKLLVDFDYSDGTHKQEGSQIFAAAHDTQTVHPDEVLDANLNTFLKMDLNPRSRLSVRAFPSDKVTTAARPFSTFITLIKWADDW